MRTCQACGVAITGRADKRACSPRCVKRLQRRHRQLEDQDWSRLARSDPNDAGSTPPDDLDWMPQAPLADVLTGGFAIRPTAAQLRLRRLRQEAEDRRAAGLAGKVKVGQFLLPLARCILQNCPLARTVGITWSGYGGKADAVT